MTEPITHAAPLGYPPRRGDATTSQMDTVIAPPATRRLSARVRELGTLAQVEKLSPGQAVAR